MNSDSMPDNSQRPDRRPGILRSWRPWTIALGSAALISLIWFIRSPGVRAKSLETNPELFTVAAVKAKRQDLAEHQFFYAEFRPYQEIDLYAKVSGFLESITVDVGDHVRAGQLLATLEIPELNDDLDHASAVLSRSGDEVNKAEATHEEAHEMYTRLAAVEKSQPNLIAQQDIDLARSKDRAAEAALAAAREQVNVAKTDIKKLKTMLNYCRIIAPFNGTITQRYVDPGALVQFGGGGAKPLVQLSQTDQLRLVFPVSISYVSSIKLADPVQVKVESLPDPITGKVARFTGKIDTATRTMEVEVDVPNPEHKVIPGMYATADVKVAQKTGALVLPVEAVSRRGKPSVYRITPDHRLEELPVELGLETPDKLEIVSGLKEDDLVMIGSRSLVRPGQKVEPHLSQDSGETHP